MAKTPGTPAFIDRVLDAVAEFVAKLKRLGIEMETEIELYQAFSASKDGTLGAGGEISTIALGTPPGGKAGVEFSRHLVVKADGVLVVILRPKGAELKADGDGEAGP